MEEKETLEEKLDRFPFLRWLLKMADEGVTRDEISAAEPLICRQMTEADEPAGPASEETRRYAAIHRKLSDEAKAVADEKKKLKEAGRELPRYLVSKYIKSVDLADLMLALTAASFHHSYPWLWGKCNAQLGPSYTVMFQEHNPDGTAPKISRPARLN